METWNNLSCSQSETSFLGCAITSEGAVLHECPATPDHFHHPANRVIFTAALSLYTAGSPVTTQTVLQRLTPDQLQNCGGPGEVAERCFFPASSGMALHFFRILEDKLSLRRAHNLARWIDGEITQTDDVNAFCTALRSKADGLENQSEGDNVLMACCDRIELNLLRMEKGDAEMGFQTKVAGWDEVFGGMMPGQMYAIAGRPGCGKTAMMEQLIGAHMKADIPVSVFEKDMSPEKLIVRMATRALGIPFTRYSRGWLKPEEASLVREMLQVFRGSKLRLYNPTMLTADKMCAIARRDIRVHGTKAVFLDHIQTLRVGKDLREGLTQASLAIRSNVTDTNIPHVILAHINREGAKGRPGPEHIKEFDQLYGDCDMMAILWSPETGKDEDSSKLKEVNFYAAKNRDGAVTEKPLLFDGALMKFKAKAKLTAP
jgi:replicative DNA helicase